MNLNERSWRRCQTLLQDAAAANVEITNVECGTRIIDCGVHATGGLAAGLALAEICLADLADVRLTSSRGSSVQNFPLVEVAVDQPLAACMASQYAGRQIQDDSFFAMGSGPMRAAWGGEALFEEIGFQESPEHVVGVLETSKLPPDSVCRTIAEACRVSPENLILLAAKTASQAGGVQVVARSVETCLHKMHELKFDLSRVRSGFGSAPLPPPAADDMAAIGRTNDAVLYGGEVTLWVTGDDESLAEIGPRVPSAASKDYGRPFGEVFREYKYDFYKIDPMLFSPAKVTLVNLDSGRSHRFGEVRPEIVEASFV